MKVYLMKDGEFIELKRSSELKIKLSRKQKKEFRQMRTKSVSGCLSFEIDPYKDFREKIKAQIR